MEPHAAHRPEQLPLNPAKEGASANPGLISDSLSQHLRKHDFQGRTLVFVVLQIANAGINTTPTKQGNSSISIRTPRVCSDYQTPDFSLVKETTHIHKELIKTE